MHEIVQRRVRRMGLGLALLLGAACADSPPPTGVEEVSAPLANLAGAEEEIFGDVFVNGSPITSGTYYVTLQKIDADGNAIGGESLMRVNPAGWGSGWMFGWFDVEATDGPCNPASKNRMEVHTDYPGGLEAHCIETGARYRFTLSEGNPDLGNVKKTFVIDYPIYVYSAMNQTIVPNVYERLEWTPWSTFTGVGYNDIYASVDLQQNSRNSDDPVLWIDNAGSTVNHYDNFTDRASPTGTKEDYFQFSMIGSGLASNIADARAREPLAKLWIYKDGALVHETGWATFRDVRAGQGLERTLRFADICQTAGTYDVALDLMRPDEPVPSAPTTNADWRTIQIASSSAPLPSHCPQPPAPPQITSVQLTPQFLLLSTDGRTYPSGGTVTATAYDQYGQAITSGLSYTWSIDNTSIAKFKGLSVPPTGANAYAVAVATGNTPVRVSVSHNGTTVNRSGTIQVNCHLNNTCIP